MNLDVSRDRFWISSACISYYQEEKINKHWLPPTIKQKLGDERKTTMDGDQIDIEDSFSVVCGGSKVKNSITAPAKSKCMQNWQKSWQRLSSQKHQMNL